MRPLPSRPSSATRPSSAARSRSRAERRASVRSAARARRRSSARSSPPAQFQVAWWSASTPPGRSWNSSSPSVNGTPGSSTATERSWPAGVRSGGPRSAIAPDTPETRSRSLSKPSSRSASSRRSSGSPAETCSVPRASMRPATLATPKLARSGSSAGRSVAGCRPPGARTRGARRSSARPERVSRSAWPLRFRAEPPLRSSQMQIEAELAERAGELGAQRCRCDARRLVAVAQGQLEAARETCRRPRAAALRARRERGPPPCRGPAAHPAARAPARAGAPRPSARRCRARGDPRRRGGARPRRACPAAAGRRRAPSRRGRRAGPAPTS